MEGEESLPLVYDPETIAAYWGKRPGSVATRIAQLLGVAGGFLSRIAMDIVTKKVKEVSRFVLWILYYCRWHQGFVTMRILLRQDFSGKTSYPSRCLHVLERLRC